MTGGKPLPKVILIGGPTASGKSARALDIAQRAGGTIINADAMQVYDGLPILTNQPSAAERALVPHDLYAATPPDQPSSVGIWLTQAHAAIARAHAASCIPILVGGTGLYFQALRDGLSAIPAIPVSVRAEVAQFYAAWGEEKFRARLATHDPEAAARIARNDRQRLLRAYEVALHTGRSLTSWQRAPVTPPAYIFETHLLMPPRDDLYAACDRRFLAMVEAGAVAEVEAFSHRDIFIDAPIRKVIGVREIQRYLSGDCTLPQAVAQAQTMTRHYAKRQMTWFRNQWEG